MLALITADLVPIALAFAIGIATGWWVWARLPARPAANAFVGAAIRPPATVRPVHTLSPVETLRPLKTAAPVETLKPIPPATLASNPSTVAEKPRAGDNGGAASAAGAVAETAVILTRPKIAPAVGAPDDLQRIKGIGPKLSALCHSLGVSRFDQIAKWTSADIAEVDHHLDGFRGRIERDHWIEQAQLLAVGDLAALEAKFGKKEGHDHEGV